MKLEHRVTNVELSNKLLDLEVRKPSQFYREWRGAKDDEIKMWEDVNGDVCLDNVNCYTVAELGEMLPTRYMQAVFHRKNIPSNNEYKHDFVVSYGRSVRSKKPVVGEVYEGVIEIYHYCYSFPSSHSLQHLNSAAVRFEALTEADARAKMLIYLIENDLVSSPHIPHP